MIGIDSIQPAPRSRMNTTDFRNYSADRDFRNLKIRDFAPISVLRGQPRPSPLRRIRRRFLLRKLHRHFRVGGGRAQCGDEFWIFWRSDSGKNDGSRNISEAIFGKKLLKLNLVNNYSKIIVFWFNFNQNNFFLILIRKLNSFSFNMIKFYKKTYLQRHFITFFLILKKL